MNSSSTNTINPTSITTQSNGEHVDTMDTEANLQLWSALTLGALQKQIEGHEDDPRFSNAVTLIDSLAKQFSTANPIDIADYFEAIESLAALKSVESLDRLNQIEEDNREKL